jgi:hypothetical protein
VSGTRRKVFSTGISNHPKPIRSTASGSCAKVW